MPLIITAIFTLESEYFGVLMSLNIWNIKTDRIMCSLEMTKT